MRPLGPIWESFGRCLPILRSIRLWYSRVGEGRRVGTGPRPPPGGGCRPWVLGATRDKTGAKRHANLHRKLRPLMFTQLAFGGTLDPKTLPILLNPFKLWQQMGPLGPFVAKFGTRRPKGRTSMASTAPCGVFGRSFRSAVFWGCLFCPRSTFLGLF